jgi:hypothetical protein
MLYPHILPSHCSANVKVPWQSYLLLLLPLLLLLLLLLPFLHF